MGKTELYTNPILHTSQFRMCGNCFRADMYRSCDFGCSYCFANNRGGQFSVTKQVAKISLIRKWFEQALIQNDTSNIKKEMLNHRVPLHLGGMSDPFQKMEFEHRATYEFLKLTKEYNYPVNISTKTAHLPEEYFDVLDPAIHTFSLSIMGYSDDYIRLFESNTPTAKERVEFARLLKTKGFWVGVRIQPTIVLDEVLQLVSATNDLVDYYTVEHLKLPVDNKAMFELIRSKLPYGVCGNLVAKGREYEFDGATKIRNIEAIKELANPPVGCGDNDLHELSESLNCCGIDTMPDAFKNWMKYNTMYIRMTGDRSGWTPKNDCNACFNSACVKQGFTNMKQYVDDYYIELYGSPNQLSLFE